MESSKKLGIALAASMAVNLFLGGVGVVALTRLRGPHPEAHPAAQPPDGPPPWHRGRGAGPGPAGRPPGEPLGPPPGEPLGPPPGPPSEEGRGGGLESPHATLRELVRVLGGPDEPRVRALLDQHREEHRALRQKVRAARAAALESLTASAFDRAQAEQRLAELREASRRAEERTQATLTELAGKLTAEERAGLRAALEGEGEGPGGPGRGRGRGGPR